MKAILIKSLVVVLISLGVTSHAQPSVKKMDFVVTTQADTLFGKAGIVSASQMDRVLINTVMGKKDLSAIEVTTIKMDGKTFRPVPYNQAYRFMEVIKDGYLTLYGYKIENQTSYSGRLLVKKDGEMLDLPPIQFRSIASDFLKECRRVTQRIDSKELKRDDIEQIVDEYNACLENKTDQRFSENYSELEKDQTLKLIASLQAGIESLDFKTKPDAIDLLKDIREKVESGQSVSNYQSKSLRKFLKGERTLEDDLHDLLKKLSGS